MPKIAFTKMHGAGNDYIYVNCLKGFDFDPAFLAVKMSPRHFSVGADGLVLILPSDIADARMRMFNADGSEGKMCGNAIRCVGKFLSDGGFVKKDVITVEALSGVKILRLFKENGLVTAVSVDMGRAVFDIKKIPALFSAPEMIKAPVEVAGKTYEMTAVSMGNPHAVIFTDEVSSLPLEAMGPSFEHLPLFPERVNTEFVKVLSEKECEMRVWERGSGETFACGTGASATVAAGVKCGVFPENSDVTVHLLGGDLVIRVSSEYDVTMTGGATKVYEGVFEYDEDQSK